MTAILTDPHLRQCLADIVKQANVSCIVETGTNDASGAIALAKILRECRGIFKPSQVFTVELNEQQVLCDSKSRIEDQGVSLCRGSSQLYINEYLGSHCWDVARSGESVLLVLDAHWNEHWPLLEELLEINRYRKNGWCGTSCKVTVLVDDFFVPSRPNFVGCYGGLRSADSDGRESELIPCGYNAPFAQELDRFPNFYYPDYDLGTMGYCIASDFQLDLGPNFRVLR